MDKQYRLAFADEIKTFADIAVTASNRSAIAAIRQPAAWKSVAMCLMGPVQCGLGVIGHLWAKETGAEIVSAEAFADMSVSQAEKRSEQYCLLDLADQVTQEDKLLTLINLIKEKDNRLLLTARSAPALWGTQLQDLKSRLSAVPIAEIYPPDEEMLKLRLLASCKRRYLLLSDGALNYLSIRLPRSYIAIEDYVARLDDAVEATGRRPTLQLVREVFEDGASSYKLFGDSLE